MAYQASDMCCRFSVVIRGAGTALVAVLLGAAPALAAPDGSDKAGIWTLAVDGVHRMCRLNLRTDPSGAGWALAMPPGCRRAVPSLKDVQSWSTPSEGQVSLDNAEGQTVMMFEPLGGGLHGTDPQGEGLSLTPLRRPAIAGAPNDPDSGSIVTLRTTDPSSQPAVSSLAQPAAAAKPAMAPVSVREAAGRYAVLRGDRDTGCMVTLDGAPGGARSVQKAHLAPACRDQGIIIFDPLGWQIVAGRLVLTARKGHTIQLERTADGGWVKDAGQVKTLGFKPL